MISEDSVQTTDVQTDPSLRTSFVMHRLMCKLFVQALTLSTLGKIFNRRHFEICFTQFSKKTGIAILCKLSPLH